MDKLLTTAEVCDRLRISQPLLRQWVHRGKIANIKFGKALMFKSSDIEALIEKNYRQAQQK